MAGFSWRTAERSEAWSSADRVLNNHIHTDSRVLKGAQTLPNVGLQDKVHTHISCPKTTLRNSRQIEIPESSGGCDWTHILLCTYLWLLIQPFHPPAGATIYVRAGGTPCSASRREEVGGILIFHLLNWISWVILTSHNCWYIMTNLPPTTTTTHFPPSTPGTQPHTHLPPPVTQLCRFLNANEATLGGEKRKKRKKAEKSKGLVHHQTNAQCRGWNKKKKNTVCSFQDVIFIFSKEGDTAGRNVQTDRQLQDERTRDRRWKRPWLWLRTALLSCAQCELMWKHVTLGYSRITCSTDACCSQKFKTGEKNEHCRQGGSVYYCF